jgi:hypothetical protein
MLEDLELPVELPLVMEVKELCPITFLEEDIELNPDDDDEDELEEEELVYLPSREPPILPSILAYFIFSLAFCEGIFSVFFVCVSSSKILMLCLQLTSIHCKV